MNSRNQEDLLSLVHQDALHAHIWIESVYLAIYRKLDNEEIILGHDEGRVSDVKFLSPPIPGVLHIVDDSITLVVNEHLGPVK